MSGAFGDLTEIIHRRMTSQNIGFGAAVKTHQDRQDILADQFKDWGEDKPAGGPVATIFQKIQDLFDHIKDAWHRVFGTEYTPDQIFAAVEKGIVGGREGEGTATPGQRFEEGGETPPFAAR